MTMVSLRPMAMENASTKSRFGKKAERGWLPRRTTETHTLQFARLNAQVTRISARPDRKVTLIAVPPSPTHVAYLEP